MTEVESLRPLVVLLIAFATSGLVVAARRWPAVRDSVPVVAAAVSFGLVASMLPTVLAGGVPTTDLGTFVPGVDLVFRADPLGLLFGLVVTGLWLPTAIYSIGYTHGTEMANVTRYNAALCVSLGSGLGVAFAGNLLVLVVFYELTTVGTYPLVAHKGTERARRLDAADARLRASVPRPHLFRLLRGQRHRFCVDFRRYGRHGRACRGGRLCDRSGPSVSRSTAQRGNRPTHRRSRG